jgi:hypothetical protein
MYKKPFMYENVRPFAVKKALEYLITTELYKENGITEDQDWLLDNNDNIVSNVQVNFIVDPEDARENRDQEINELGEEIDDNLPDLNLSPIVFSQENSDTNLINEFRTNSQNNKGNEGSNPTSQPFTNG